jgi:hypothetical protein
MTPIYSFDAKLKRNGDPDFEVIVTAMYRIPGWIPIDLEVVSKQDHKRKIELSVMESDKLIQLAAEKSDEAEAEWEASRWQEELDQRRELAQDR